MLNYSCTMVFISRLSIDGKILKFLRNVKIAWTAIGTFAIFTIVYMLDATPMCIKNIRKRQYSSENMYTRHKRPWNEFMVIGEVKLEKKRDAFNNKFISSPNKFLEQQLTRRSGGHVRQYIQPRHYSDNSKFIISGHY